MFDQEERLLTNQLGKLDSSKSLEECMAQVRAVFDLYEVGHGCLQTLNNEITPSEALWRVTPDDVTTACSRLVRLKKHPALMAGQNRHFPFNLLDFRDHFSGDPDIDALYESFDNNDLIAVYALPIKAKSGTYVFVVGRPNETMALTELLALQTICTNAINKVVQFKRRPCDNEIQRILTSGQKKVLIGLAKGMDDSTIARTLDMSEQTIATLTQQVIETLGAANARHAIILSLISGELTLQECAPLQRTA